MTYKIPSPSTPTQSPITNAVLRIDADGTVWSIPFNPANTDYQAYLQWLEEGGVPEAADDVSAQ